MLGTYWRITFRALVRDKGYALINIFGLSLALSFFFLIALFVRNELTYDVFHANSDRVYRVGREVQLRDDTRESAYTPVPLGPSLKRDFAEIEDVVRFWRAFQPVVRSGDKLFKESGFYFTDPGVFRMFSFELLRGDRETALLQPGSVVLTESAARKYFDDSDPIGHILSYEGYPAGRREFKVTGIVQDVPANSQFAFDFLASATGIETEAENWGSSKPIWTYVLLASNASREFVGQKIAGQIEHYHESSSKTVVHLEPLRDVHLFSRFGAGFKPPGDINQIYAFAAIGLFILLLACVNFINLSTARSMKRAREVGMRKTFGAHRWQLVLQFIGEAMLTSALAVFLAAIFVEVLLPYFNAILNTEIVFDIVHEAASLLATIVVVGFLAGMYPAFFLAGFDSVKVLKSGHEKRVGKTGLRRALVVFQFVISIALIIGTLMVRSQLLFIQDKKLGFDKDLVVVLPHGENEEALMNTLLQNPRVLNAAVSQRVPVNNVNSDGRTIRVEGMDEPVRVESYIIGDRFLETYGMTLVAGRGFAKERQADTEGFLINETAVKAFGLNVPSEALGKELTWSGQKTGRIIGVVKNFHTSSLHEQIEPLVLLTLPGDQWWRIFVSARIAPQDISGTLQFIESVWRTHSPETPFRHFFIDESLVKLHEADAKFGQMFTAFAALAIVIACLGLFGLAAFSAEQRTKEVGIRKVLGASARNVVSLLSKEFLILVVIANALAWPITYFIMNSWLENFAYRVELDVGLFVIGGSMALIIALVTVGYHALKAAWTNPVNALRYE